MSDTTNQGHGNNNGGEPGNNTQPATDATNTGNGATGTTPEPISFTALQQAHIDKIVGDRLAENTRKIETANAVKLKAEQDRAEQQKLVEAGEWQKLAEANKAEADANAAEIARLKAESEAKDFQNLKLRIASDAKLPAGWENRLTGTTEAELKADAAAIAKELKLPTPPNQETQRYNQQRHEPDKQIKDAQGKAPYRM